MQHIVTDNVAGLGAACLVGCATLCPRQIHTSITKADFGKTPDGKAVEIYTLRNGKGAEARIMTYGGIVQSLSMPDKNGKLGRRRARLRQLRLHGLLLKDCPYFGALIGRYGNRIGGAKFTLEGQTYTLATNNGRIRCTAA